MVSNASVSGQDWNEILILTFQGNVVDPSREARLIEEITEIVKEAEKVVIDLQGVIVLPSAVIGWFVTIHRALNGGLVLCNLSRELAEQFQGTRLDQLFTTCSDLSAAIAHFEQ